MPELIDRLQTIQQIKNTFCSECDCEYGDASCKVCEYDFCIGILNEQPTIEAEPTRHGQWIAVSSFEACGGDEEVWMAHGNPIAYHYCSECKNETYLNEEGKEILSDYCPFCGADMRDGGIDDDSE